MMISNIYPALVAGAVLLRSSSFAFTPIPSAVVRATSVVSTRETSNAQNKHRPASSAFLVQAVASPEDVLPTSSPRVTQTRVSFERVLQGAVLAAATSFAGAAGALAEYIDPDDVGELVASDLPPMWVPLALGVVLTLGIALLQGSLGDVMNDEAKLGALSGARAAKQSARDRDMFKKKDPK